VNPIYVDSKGDPLEYTGFPTRGAGIPYASARSMYARSISPLHREAGFKPPISGTVYIPNSPRRSTRPVTAPQGRSPHAPSKSPHRPATAGPVRKRPGSAKAKNARAQSASTVPGQPPRTKEEQDAIFDPMIERDEIVLVPQDPAHHLPWDQEDELVVRHKELVQRMKEKGKTASEPSYMRCQLIF